MTSKKSIKTKKTSEKGFEITAKSKNQTTAADYIRTRRVTILLFTLDDDIGIDKGRAWEDAEGAMSKNAKARVVTRFH